MFNLKKLVVLAVLPLVVILSGCSINKAENSDKTVPAASQPTEAPKQETQKLLGETVTYVDNVSVSVSVPAAYAPTETAAGVNPGETYLIFNVVITNNSDANVDVGGFPSVNSGGVEASAISDVANNVGYPPYTTLLPGQSISFQDAYSVKDPVDITYFIQVGIMYEQAIFTLK